MDNPILLTQPFANNGEKNDIPNTQLQEGDGKFSQSKGFPGETAIPLINGGKPPTREDMNGAFYMLSSILFLLQKGKVFEYDEYQDYYSPALVTDNGVVYYCIKDMPMGTVKPSMDVEHTYWMILSDKIYSDLVTGKKIQYSDIQGVPTKVSQFENDADYQNGEQVDTFIHSQVDPINAKISEQASATNKLIDKAYVDDSIQMHAAHPRGNWETWEDVPSNATGYPPDDKGNKKPTQNDYMVVNDATGYEATRKGAWYFVYSGEWDTKKKNGWVPLFRVNEEPFTPAQNNAINSGITNELVVQITTNKNEVAKKANSADLGVVAFSNDYLDLDNRYVLPVATNNVLGGIKKGPGIDISTDGTASIDTVDIVNKIDWTQLNTSEKLCNDGANGVIDLSKGRVHITSAEEITMPTPPDNCATWVTLYCTSGKVNFVSDNVVYEIGGPYQGTGMAVYTLSGIGTGVWYCTFNGFFPKG